VVCVQKFCGLPEGLALQITEGFRGVLSTTIGAGLHCSDTSPASNFLNVKNETGAVSTRFHDREQAGGADFPP